MIASIAIAVAMILLFLATFFSVSSKCEKFEPQLQSAFANGNTRNNLKPYDSTTIPYIEVKDNANNLTHDQIDIRVEDDDGNDIISTTDNQSGEIDEPEEDDVIPKNNYRLPRDLSPLHYELVNQLFK